MAKRSKILLSAAVLIAVCGAICYYGQEIAVVDDSLLRFHVIANSDAPLDQGVKLDVRDAVLTTAKPLLEGVTSEAEAEAVLSRHQGEIVAAAEAVLAEVGVGYGVTAEVTAGAFPTKSYGNLTLPAGRYRCCRLILGEGKGKNWWCVLYPPLCFVRLNEDTAIAVARREELSESGDVLAVDGGLTKTEIKSKLLEWLRK